MERSPATPYVALWTLSGCYFTLAVASLSVVGLLEPMAAGLAVSDSAIAYLVSAFALTYAVAAPAAQMLFGDRDRKVLLLMGLAAIGTGCLTTALVQDYAVVTAGRILMAVGAAVVGPMASATGAALVPPEKRGSALAIVFTGMTIATVMGVPLTAFLGGVIGWRWTLVVITLVAVAVAAAVQLTVPGDSRGARASPAAVLAVLTDRVLALAVSITFFQMAAQFVTYAVIAVYLSQRFGVGAELLPITLFGYGIGGVIGNVISMRLGDRLGADRLIQTSLTALVIVFIALHFLPGETWVLLVLMPFWSISGMILFAPQQSRLIQLAPEQANLLLALNGSSLYLGMAAGAALSGLLLQETGIAYLAIASAGLVAMALAAFLISSRTARGRAQSDMA